MTGQYDLLHKTELQIHGIHLTSGNLSIIAQRVAEELGLEPQNVIVIDVLPGIVSLDILASHVDPERVVGQSRQLLQALASLEGVSLDQDATIESCGILGLLSLDPLTAKEVLNKSDSMVREMAERIARRAYILPTGYEVVNGMIEDTNSPYLRQLLRSEGYAVTIGPPVEDDLGAIARRFLDACAGGYGLVISTGGVGAEGKDKSVEALIKISDKVETPYILQFAQGTGRHVKHGVRIGVGTCGRSLLICLPGPHDEVQLTGPVIVEGLRRGWDTQTLAGKIATTLRQKWVSSTVTHPHTHHGAKHEQLS